ncbi:hypothetical protein EJV47_02960 [Hymenobacter gummosus]|uniref:Uncharacterized protein n=1 Tax=Hymenobacter gummosus TaxID=1776032 RepID=A0A431U902_9BACT|nr:hypothetical protein [Hymenobacter gummosus]RTQ53711.1 hypothetical protein EJV47_02960 [Hymenobacter gummosus]
MPLFTPHRALAMLLTAALPALAFTCGTPPCDLCEPCPTQRLGSLGLQARSRTWLPATSPDSVRFVSSNGFRAALQRVPLPPDSVPVLPGRYPEYSALTYAAPSTCGEYYQAERLRLRYQGRNINLTLTHDLTRDLSGQYPQGNLPLGSPLTRASADTLPDVVLLDFNGTNRAVFPVVRRPYRSVFQPPSFGGQVRYQDSVRLAGRTFFGVYQFEQLNSLPNALTLRYLYFQPGQGVVGFTYTNNEQWARF